MPSDRSTGNGSFRTRRLINRPNPTLVEGVVGQASFCDSARAHRRQHPVPPSRLTKLDSRSRSLQRLVRRPRLSALGRCAGDAIERARGNFAGAGQGATARRSAPEDVIAYIAAVMAHPAFTARFKADLVRPGLRVPLTADKALFDEAAALGREVVWLHCYGERFVDRGRRPAERAAAPAGERERRPFPPTAPFPARPSRCPRPWITTRPSGASSSARASSRTSRRPCGITRFPARHVLDQWFSYRRRDRTKPHDRRQAAALAAGKDPARRLARRIYRGPA